MNPMEFTLNPHTNFLTTVNVKPRDLFRIEDTWFLLSKTTGTILTIFMV